MLVECPITKLPEISGFDTCCVCVCEYVREGERETEKRVRSRVMEL